VSQWTQAVNEIEADLNELAQAVETEAARVQNERDGLYFRDGTPRYDRETMRDRERRLDGDHDLRDAMARFVQRRAEADAQLRAMRNEAQAIADATGQDPTAWVYDAPKAAARLQLQHAVLAAMTDEQAVAYLRRMAVAGSQQDAVGWMIAGKTRLKGNLVPRSDGAFTQHIEGAQQVIDDLTELATPERVKEEFAVAVARVEDLDAAHRRLMDRDSVPAAVAQHWRDASAKPEL
jgi:hypothetical protein